MALADDNTNTDSEGSGYGGCIELDLPTFPSGWSVNFEVGPTRPFEGNSIKK